MASVTFEYDDAAWCEIIVPYTADDFEMCILCTAMSDRTVSVNGCGFRKYENAEKTPLQRR